MKISLNISFLIITLLFFLKNGISKDFKFWIGDTTKVDLIVDDSNQVYLLDTTYSLKKHLIKRKGQYKLFFDKEFTQLYKEFEIKQISSFQGETRHAFGATTTIYYKDGQKKWESIKADYNGFYYKIEGINQYYPNGNLKVGYHRNNNVDLWLIYVYDEYGRIKKSITNSPEIITTYYNDDGNIYNIEFSHYKFEFDDNLNLKKHCQNIYIDSKGNIVRSNSGRKMIGYNSTSLDCKEID